MLDPTDYSFLKVFTLCSKSTKDLSFLTHPMPEGVAMALIWHTRQKKESVEGSKTTYWFSYRINIPLATGKLGFISGFGYPIIPCLTEPEQNWNVVPSHYTDGSTKLSFRSKDPDEVKRIEDTGIKENVQKYSDYCMQVAKEYMVYVFAEANAKHIRDRTERLAEAAELLSQSLKF